MFLVIQNVRLSSAIQERDLLGQRVEALSMTHYIFARYKTEPKLRFEQLINLTTLNQLFSTIRDSDYGRRQHDYTIDYLAMSILSMLEVNSIDELDQFAETTGPEVHERLTSDNELKSYFTKILNGKSQANDGG